MSRPPSEMLSDCTEKCKSTQHGDAISAAITKRGLTDAELCCYLNYICLRCESVRDSAGRTALHVAASCGRTDLVKWLVQNRNASVNAKDNESGYTPLHRSVFYGKIETAMELIKLGANTSVLDLDSLTYLEHLISDGYNPDFENRVSGEVYVWGTNANNTLGPQKARDLPDILDVFHKEYALESVQQICVAKFHTVIVTNSGKVYSSGHGQGGRLGLGVENAVISPKEIKLHDLPKSDPVTCVQASVSKDHTLFLTSDLQVQACGLNTYHVLGIESSCERILVPKRLENLSIDLRGVCTGSYHSVAWGRKGLYTWGLNAGQLGHLTRQGVDVDYGKYITLPKLVECINLNDTSIKCVTASDGATVVCTEKGDIIVLHEFQCRKIASRQLNAVQLAAVGGKLNCPLDRKLFANKSPNSELRVVVLTNTGCFYLWQESDPHLCRCIFNINRHILVKNITLNLNEILFVTQYGEAFKGVFTPRKKRTPVEKEKHVKKSAFHEFLEKDECVMVKLQKFPRVHRAVYIQSDAKGHDYAVIQNLPYKYFNFPEITPSEMKIHFKIFFDNIDINDSLHDIQFKVKDRLFPAHSYIVAMKSPHLFKLITEQHKISNSMVINIDDVHPDIFEQLLYYCYTGDCDLIRCGEVTNIKLRRLYDQLNQIGPNDSNGSCADKCDYKKIDISVSESYTNSKSKENIENITTPFKNPVRMLHEVSKRFGMVDLQKLLSDLDMYKFTIKLKSGAKDAWMKTQHIVHKFDRQLLPELYDVNITCRDGKKIQAHKCILAARLEYFDAMFSVRWRGCDASNITLPYAKSTAEAMLDYLYSDTLQVLNNKDFEHLFKILVLADQLFATRLKEQCECLLSNSLTLKNAVQLLTFADNYNADKLKTCTMEFIVSNLAPLLEIQALDDIDGDILRELSQCYFDTNSNLWCRVITPYSVAVSDDDVLRINMMYPIDLNDSNINNKDKNGKSSAQKRRLRSQRHNSEKTHSISLENAEIVIQFPDVTDIPTVPIEEKSLNVRIKAISLAKDIIQNEDVEYKFEKLNSSFDFPELNSPPNVFHQKASQKSGSEFRHSKIGKVSQKQRKRLLSECSVNAVAPIAVSESPKNPWKILSESSSPSSSSIMGGNHEENTMGSIIFSEKKQKENFVKLTNKPLIYTQLEDKAIDDLHKFYNTDNIFDEIISIDRVSLGVIASPVWVPAKTSR